MGRKRFAPVDFLSPLPGLAHSLAAKSRLHRGLLPATPPALNANKTRNLILSNLCFKFEYVRHMKKEYIAVYLGLALFFVIFACSALLDSAGRKHQSRIGIAVSLILFGITVLVGL